MSLYVRPHRDRAPVVYCTRCKGEVVNYRQPLTPKQAAILAFLREHIATHEYAPSFEEIADRFGYRSLATVHEHLGNLERKRYITRGYNECRAIALIEATPV